MKINSGRALKADFMLLVVAVCWGFSYYGMKIALEEVTTLSAALMLRYAFGLNDEAAAIEAAVERTVGNGALPTDLGGQAGTWETTDQVLAQLAAL